MVDGPALCSTVDCYDGSFRFEKTVKPLGIFATSGSRPSNCVRWDSDARGKIKRDDMRLRNSHDGTKGLMRVTLFRVILSLTVHVVVHSRCSISLTSGFSGVNSIRCGLLLGSS